MPFDLAQAVDRGAFSADGTTYTSALSSSPQSRTSPASQLDTSGASSLEAESKQPPSTGNATPSFARLLGVSPRFIARHAHSATEATLLLDVASAANELDMLLESLADQLGDRARIRQGLQLDEMMRREERIKEKKANFAHATILVLQKQAQGENDQNVEFLLRRFQEKLQVLLDLRFLLAMEVEKQHACQEVERRAMSGNGDANGDASTASTRDEMLQLETALLERIGSLEQTMCFPSEVIALSSLEETLQRKSSQQMREVCWPVLSNSISDISRLSQGNVRLSTPFGSTPSSSTTMSGAGGNDGALTENEIVIVDDPTPPIGGSNSTN